MTISFNDIQGHWAEDCIRQLATYNLVQGYPDGRFAPDQSLTRAEFAALVYVTFSDADVRREPIIFDDVADTHWAHKAIQFAYQTGFLSGYPQQCFKPDMAMPRVQSITALVSGLGYDTPVNVQVLDYLDDGAEIPSYAVGAIASAIQHRLIINYPNLRQLQPNANITRGELAVLLCRALQFYSVPQEFIVGHAADFPHPDTLMAVRPQFTEIGDSSYYPVQNLFVDGLARVELNGKNGFINTQGQLVIPPELTTHNQVSFREGRLPVVMNGKLGYIDQTGKVVVAPQFAHAEAFNEGLAVVAMKLDENLYDYYGVIDRSGDFVVSPQYDGITSFNDGLAMAVTFSGLCNGIDRTGRIVFQIDGISPRGGFSNGYAAFTRNKKMGLLDRQGNIVLEPNYARIRSFSEERVWVQLNSKDIGWTCIDFAGNPISPLSFSYESTQPFVNGWIRATTIDGKSGTLDHDGNFSTEFEWIGPFSEGLAAALTNTHQGYINVNREWVISPQFDDPRQQNSTEAFHRHHGHSFSEGRAAILQNGKFGFIDKTGNLVIPAQFEWVAPFSDGLAAVRQDGNDFYIDLAGQKIFESQFPISQDIRYELVSFKDGYAIFVGDKGYGLLDKAGNIVIPDQFNRITADHPDYDGYRWLKVSLKFDYPRADVTVPDNHPPYTQTYTWGLIRLPKTHVRLSQPLVLHENSQLSQKQGLKQLTLT